MRVSLLLLAAVPVAATLHCGLSAKKAEITTNKRVYGLAQRTLNQPSADDQYPKKMADKKANVSYPFKTAQPFKKETVDWYGWGILH
jgi:hypothetical protein